MLLKKPTAIEGKKLLGFIILGSALVHFLVIFFLPAGRSTREHLYNAFKARGADSVSLEIVEISPQEQEKQLQTPKEELKEEKEALEEDSSRRQQFVDTGGSTTDEEVRVETEKVGEKGTLAKDTTPGGSDDRPRLEGTTEAPSIGGSPGEAQGPPDTPEAEASKTLVAESAPGGPQESASEGQGVETEVASEEENEVEEEVAEAVQGATPAPQESQAPEPLAQGPEPAEKPPQEESESSTAELPQEGKIATQAEGSETQAPLEDKKVPLLAETEKTTGENAATREESQLEKELRRLEVKEDGLIPIPKKEPHELAYVPPWELRGRVREVTRPKGQATATAPARRKPKVAISFNAKTLSGGDIMPMMDAAEANATGEGSPSFNVKKDEYAPYYKHIRDKISWYWFLGYGTRQEIKLETENDQPIIAEFKVYPEGMVKEVKIIQEAGNHLLASRIKDSIEATRLDKFSRYGVKEEYIDVRFNFYFF